MSDLKAIYIHVPFCRRKCKYCSFISYQSREDDIPAYLDAVKNELFLRSEDTVINTVYFGRGTPSLLTSEQISSLMSTIKNNFNTENGSEITMETNPGTIDLTYLSKIKAAGINRLSIGVQSF
ncbi:MAG: radical SAM protein, partial [Dehalococcoidales bacterium]|nr:radical SAM protein [Dehalococcoidales bacterium]